MTFFFNDTATTEIYTLSLHDALPILLGGEPGELVAGREELELREPGDQRLGEEEEHHEVDHGGDAEREGEALDDADREDEDRKSTRLNSSHANTSYAVFCLKKKNTLFASLLPLDHSFLSAPSSVPFISTY